jgi:CDP-4-dehydro-6-deoxyglucose reductase, E3
LTTSVLARIAHGDKLGVELAFRQFFPRVADMPAIFLVSGAGFAPIKSLIEDALERGIGRPMRLYRGGRSQDDFYLLDCIATWAQRAPWLSFVPVLSRSCDPRQGRTGFLHRVVLQEKGNMTDVEVYACGNPLMIAAASGRFRLRRRDTRGAFLPDAFVASGWDTWLT